MLPVNNYVIDFKSYVINKKLMDYRKVDEEVKPFYFTEYDLSNLVQKINENFGEDIHKQDCIKAIIDY
jgi:hypothetical protein